MKRGIVDTDEQEDVSARDVDELDRELFWPLGLHESILAGHLLPRMDLKSILAARTVCRSWKRYIADNGVFWRKMSRYIHEKEKKTCGAGLKNSTSPFIDFMKRMDGVVYHRIFSHIDNVFQAVASLDLFVNNFICSRTILPKDAQNLLSRITHIIFWSQCYVSKNSMFDIMFNFVWNCIDDGRMNTETLEKFVHVINTAFSCQVLSSVVGYKLNITKIVRNFYSLCLSGGDENSIRSLRDAKQMISVYVNRPEFA